MNEGRVEVNGLELAFLEEGRGPLALCLHGFPGSPAHFRFLMPALAEAGYRAVAPWMRGFAPSGVPDEPIGLVDLVADANALHEALGGGSDAVIIGHDWGAITAWGAAMHGETRWSKVVGMDIPPFPFLGRILNSPATPELNHLWFLHMEDIGEGLAVDNFAYLDHLWQTWAAPGSRGEEDLVAAKAALREPENQQAVLSLYRTVAGPERYGTMDWVGDQLEVWGRLPDQPTLYLHGSHDGVVPMPDEMLAELAAVLGCGSQVRVIEAAGHFTAAEQPGEVNEAILTFLAAP
jgi:pimeloyl-ACP methyl ester carboxylesterase